MAVLKNRAKMSTSTTGTGTITLGSAESGYQTFADAGVANADVVRYVIEDTGGAFEIGTGTYTATGTTLSRTVSESSNSDAAINLSGSATVFIGATAEDIPALYADNPSSATTPVASGANAVAIGDGATASGSDSYAIGNGVTASAARSIAIGEGTNNASQSVLIGFSTGNTVSGSQAVGIGRFVTASGTGSLAIGGSVAATSNYASAIGRNSSNGGSQAVTGAGAMALGGSYASGTDSFAAAIGNNTSTYGATGSNSIAMGLQAKANSTNGISIGSSTQAAYQALAIGTFSTATASRSAAIGYANTASHANAIAIGSSVQSTATDQVSIGGTTDTVRISETYTLPTADGSNGYVLTTNGSGVASWAAGGGGGSPDLFAENYDGTSTLPSATGTNALALQDGAVASANRSIAVGRDAVSSGNYAVALGVYTDAINSFGTALGYKAQTASGDYATALTNSRASGSNSFAAAIADNTSSYGATGANSIAIGSQAKATSSDAVAIGDRAIASSSPSLALGARSEATAANSIAIGLLSDATGQGAIALGNGYSFNGAQATFYNSIAIGQGSLSDKIGKVAISGAAFSSSGDGQHGIFVLRVATTDATPAPLITGPDYVGSYTADTENQIILPNNSAYSFSGTIIARESAAAGSDYASWEIKGALLRDANAASTVLGNGIQNKLYATSGASAWAIALTADTTNGGLKIEVTGAASTNIRWVATVNTSEVTYA